VAVPGSIEARWERLAGDPGRRSELYWARRRLGFSIDEWVSLPWWQRRVYIEGMNNEAEEQSTDTGEGGSPGLSGADAILYGDMSDLASAGFGT
jgi:hypothetical protein